jgi:hypothetical protein
VFAWLLIQVTVNTVAALGMPEWVDIVVFFFSIIGFSICLFFAWAFDVTPEMFKKEADISPAESITAHTDRRLSVSKTAKYFTFISKQRWSKLNV